MKCYIKDYPRPQFMRTDWENLNGTWDFGFDDENAGEKEKWYQEFKGDKKINVPFTYETKLSGIQDETRHDFIWYHRTINVDGVKLENNRYILHFEGSDFITKVWVNDAYAGSHRGGYARCSFDVTNLVHDGENELTVKVEDSFDTQQPRGKQRWINENFGCWYVQTTGIWKTVWSEYVPKISLASVKMTPDLQNATLKLEYEVAAAEKDLDDDLMITATVSFRGTTVAKQCVLANQKHVETTINVAYEGTVGLEWGVRVWTPAEPDLYDIDFAVTHKGEIVDTVGSYFAMREIRIDGPNILLNGHPLYQRLILDQGYWKDSHLTPPSEEALVEDIDKIHALGYNGLRKHQKTEDERFLYWCDVKGMLAGEGYPVYEMTISDITKNRFKVILSEKLILDYADGKFRMHFTDQDKTSVSSGRSMRYVEVEEVENLKILADTSSVEVFVNDGEYVFSTRYYPEVYKLQAEAVGAQITLSEIM